MEFYASIRLGVDHIDAGTTDDGANGRDYLSRIGVNASSDLGNGMTAVGQIEYGLREDNLVDLSQNKGPTLRLANAGLKGGFGEVRYGSQTLLWHKFVRSAYFSDNNDSIRQATIRDDDLLQYYYKSGNWIFGAGLQTKGQDGDSVDQYLIGGEYKRGAFKLQAAYSKDNQGLNRGDLLGLRVWWFPFESLTFSAYMHAATKDYDIYTGSSTGNVRLRGASVEGNVNGVPGAKGEDRSSSGIYASYRYLKNQIHARYAKDIADISGDVSSIKIEYVYHFSDKFRMWVSHENLANDDTRKPETTSGKDMSETQFGIRYDL